MKSAACLPQKQVSEKLCRYLVLVQGACRLLVMLGMVLLLLVLANCQQQHTPFLLSEEDGMLASSVLLPLLQLQVLQQACLLQAPASLPLCLWGPVLPIALPQRMSLPQTHQCRAQHAVQH